MGSPIPAVADGQPASKTTWVAFRSTCIPAGCTATSTKLDEKNPSILATPPWTNEWRFIDGRWRTSPKKHREHIGAEDKCRVEDDKWVAGDEVQLDVGTLTPRPDGSLEGETTMTVVSGDCGAAGSVFHYRYTMTRVGGVPPNISVADPLTVGAPEPPVVPVPVPGPVLDGTYRFDYDFGDGVIRTYWWTHRSLCTATGCAAAGARLDDTNHHEPTGGARILTFDGQQWVTGLKRMRLGGSDVGCEGDAEDTTSLKLELTPQPDGSLKGTSILNYESHECGHSGTVRTPVIATRTGPVPPNVVLADPALFV